jgi:small subunit ribosomal protein S16
MEGAQPSETVAYLLKKEGVLDEFFSQRPKAKDKFKFLDKTTGTMSKKSVVQEMPAAAPVAEAPAPVEEAPVAEAPATEEAPAEATE